MALAIATNTGALMAAASATSVNKDMETSMERLSTGKRINSAKDDAAGVAIASRLSSEIRGTNQAIRNAADGQGLINTAEGAHKEVENILQRMRELAVQSANDTNDSADRTNLQAEMDQLLTEINRISEASSWAGQQLLDGDGTGQGTAEFNLQIGSGSNGFDTLTVSINAMSALALGIDTAASVTTSAVLTGATNASVSIADGVLTVASGYTDDDVVVAQTVGGSASAAMGITTTDTDGVISVGAAAFVDNDVYTVVPVAMTSISVADAAGVLTVTAGAVLAADMAFADTDTTGTAATLADDTITFTAAGGTADGTTTLTLDGVAFTIEVADGVDTTETLAAKMTAAINTGTSSSSVRATYTGAAVTLERIGLAADQGGSVSLLVDGVQTDVALTGGDTVEEIMDKIAAAFVDPDSNSATADVISAQTSVTDATAGTVTLARETALVDGKLALTIGSGDPVEVTVTKGDTFDEIATAIETAVNAATATVGASATATGGSVALARVFSAGDITFDVNGTEISTTLAGGESAEEIATAIFDQIAAQGFTDIEATDNSDGTVDIGALNFGVQSRSAAASALDTIDVAISEINTQRATLGAISNRLDSTVNNLTNIAINLEGGKGRIEDADFAAESTSLAKSQILQQASTAMLAQANASKQSVLSLLQG
ncbi:flagellin [Yoonia vestfoldensis]|uniref:Flagellin n=1 Tax=Yoonia vestfoldensis TaxID=245188 RepID=A0A1Y0EGE9_9RHOB|nr:flagellin [Yoonia vestfoldensis]ARU02695.1 A-type flagellin [Yoonia vestfoldensis]